jgi:cytochrome c peroxidase
MRNFLYLTPVISIFLLTPVAPAEAPDYRSFFAPLPTVAESKENPLSEAKIALGKKLYLETRLSKNNDISCNSCHGLNSFGVDNKPTSPGHKGQLGGRNSPTSFNAALHVAQFWDGRAKDVEEQALGPILNPVEMALESEQAAVDAIKDDPAYKTLFAKAFPKESDPISFKNIGKAIGAFERTLLTPSRFDEYLKGSDSALTKEEKAGLSTFVKTGCTACHSGVGLGGHMYQKLGLVKPYETKDTGRAEVTGKDSDKYFFKVPSLRNIAKTGPYFHDGSISTLESAVKIMGEYQLGKKLSDKETSEIVVFLNSLTGELPE